MSDPVRELFDSFKTEADLRRAVTESREENLYLEFKEKKDRRGADLAEDDRKHFSKALSAFANAAGGVLIFGIATAGPKPSPDHASELKPITSASEFLTRLRDSVLTATQPVVDDVEFRLIPTDVNAGKGYVACLVPPSEMPPHRAMRGQREYYRRTDGGCRQLEHLDLEDMFGRRPRPLLRLLAELRPRPDGDPHEELHVFLVNEGRTVAKYAGLWGRLLDEGAMLTGGRDGITDVSHLNDLAPCFSFSDNDGVIHSNGITVAAGSAIVRRPSKGQPLRVAFRWYCDGMRTRETECLIAPGPAVMMK